MILIISNKWDVSVDFVVRILSEKGEEFLRLNTEDLPLGKAKIDFDSNDYVLGDHFKSVSLNNRLRSVWYRRPGKPLEFDLEKKKQLDPEAIRFIEEQWLTFIQGIIAMPNVLWINDPFKNITAENKILQLFLARSIGFKIPKTCITSSIDDLKKFWNKCHGQVVAKALECPLIETKKTDYFIFTTILNSLDSIDSEELKLNPTIFQERLHPKVDYRVTVVGDDVFVVKISKLDHSEVEEDWRTEKEGLIFEQCSLSGQMENKCKALVARFGLFFGAIDLVFANGNFYFLELNPSGEWGWLQTNANLPIAESLASLLSRA